MTNVYVTNSDQAQEVEWDCSIEPGGTTSYKCESTPLGPEEAWSGSLTLQTNKTFCVAGQKGKEDTIVIELGVIYIDHNTAYNVKIRKNKNSC